MAMPGPATRSTQGPLRVGILGAGMIATVEPGYLPGLRRLRGRVEVTAIASRTRARAEQVTGTGTSPWSATTSPRCSPAATSTPWST